MSDFDKKSKNWDEDPSRKALAMGVADGITSSVPLSREMSMLDYGCGTGLLGSALQPYVGEITFADSSIGMLDMVQRKIASREIRKSKTLLLDLEKDRPLDTKYDIICSSMCMHHVLELDRVLLHFHTILNPSGWLCIADLSKEDGSFHGSDFKGHNGFDQNELSSKLERIGFYNIRSKTVYECEKVIGGIYKKFPIFLTTARKI